MRNGGLKKLLLLYGGVLIVLIISCITVYVVYNNKVKESARESLIAAQKITELVPNDNMFEEASTEISKSINEAILELANDVNEIKQEETENDIENSNDESEETVTIQKPVKELEFMYPVEGEILKEYAMDNLVFSETLQEWIVHKGIDIKAPRTTVIKAAEEGTVTKVKNDPRYGLSVIIEHRDGFKTVYANLLTSEFVSEGENVEKGQSIGTVGNSAAFEIADEPHLHFEMLKNEENVDPTLYLK